MKKSRSPSTESGISTEPERIKETIKDELERLMVASIIAFNNASWDHDGNKDEIELRSRVSPKFQCFADLDGLVSLTWDQPREVGPAMVELNPECEFEIISLSTDINANATAIVHMELAVTGVLNVRLARFLACKWRKIQGKWWYYKCTSIGGSSDGV